MPESTEVFQPMIICVLGMHRSGTSLLTRILNLIGLDLGPESLMLQPGEGQPKGYWENLELIHLNDAILAKHGGSWDEPPVFPSGWESSSSIEELKERARTLIQDTFGDAGLWGWKDPRNCLTLPFWQQVLPEMRYVICLRNPVDVAHSLEHRDGFSAETSTNLWLTYVNSALEHSEGRPRLIIFYDDLLDDCLSDLKLLAEFLGKPERAGQVEVQEAVQEFVEKGFQHYRSSIAEVAASPRIALRARALYIALRISVSFGGKGTNRQQGLDHQIQNAPDILSQYSFKARLAKTEQALQMLSEQR